MYVHLPHGPSKFRLTVGKPFVTPESSERTAQNFDNFPISSSTAQVTNWLPICNSAHRNNIASSSSPVTKLFTYASIMEQDPESHAQRLVQPNEDKKYAYSGGTEIFGLHERGVFYFVPRPLAANTWRMMVSHCRAKNFRFVGMAYNDNYHGFIAHSLTVQKSSQRLLFLAACDFSLKLSTRYMNQTYLQSKMPLSRPIYVKPPDIMKILSDLHIRHDRPLYGVPEAGAHWYNTYHSHHTDRLNMTAATHDPCLLYTAQRFAANRNSEVPRGVACLQIDDTLTASNSPFLAKEEKSSVFSCKPR